MIRSILNLPSYLLRKIKSKKISYSLTGVDLVLRHIFKNKNNGFYIDVGCNHPVFNNNTYLFYIKGWKGINIDIDEKSIEICKQFRKKDLNLNLAVSDKNAELEYLHFHKKSPINQIKTTNNLKVNNYKEIRKINSSSLDSIIENSNFKDVHIDFISIDVEGYELKVIEGFNLEKYKPSIIVVEYLDLNIKKLELKNFKIDNIINSEIYKMLTSRGYNLVNWLHSDLIFSHKDF